MLQCAPSLLHDRTAAATAAAASRALRSSHGGAYRARRCTRAAFHDGGANSLDEVGATVGTKKGQVVTAPKGGGGLDASLLLTDEQLRTENAYDR